MGNCVPSSGGAGLPDGAQALFQETDGDTRNGPWKDWYYDDNDLRMESGRWDLGRASFRAKLAKAAGRRPSSEGHPTPRRLSKEGHPTPRRPSKEGHPTRPAPAGQQRQAQRQAQQQAQQQRQSQAQQQQAQHQQAQQQRQSQVQQQAQQQQNQLRQNQLRQQQMQQQQVQQQQQMQQQQQRQMQQQQVARMNASAGGSGSKAPAVAQQAAASSQLPGRVDKSKQLLLTVAKSDLVPVEQPCLLRTPRSMDDLTAQLRARLKISGEITLMYWDADFSEWARLDRVADIDKIFGAKIQVRR